jgi:hypothetical protein
MTNVISTIWFDRLLTEIIFHIFDYLLNKSIEIDCDQLFNCVKQFSSSLNCLSLDLVNFEY